MSHASSAVGGLYLLLLLILVPSIIVIIIWWRNFTSETAKVPPFSNTNKTYTKKAMTVKADRQRDLLDHFEIANTEEVERSLISSPLPVPSPSRLRLADKQARCHTSSQANALPVQRDSCNSLSNFISETDLLYQGRFITRNANHRERPDRTGRLTRRAVVVPAWPEIKFLPHIPSAQTRQVDVVSGLEGSVGRLDELAVKLKHFSIREQGRSRITQPHAASLAEAYSAWLAAALRDVKPKYEALPGPARIPLTKRPLVYLDVALASKPLGRITAELFSDVVPRTAENFRCLCTGERGVGSRGKPLHYKGSVIHRIVKNFMIQGGDITRGDGVGGDSIYGGSFDDEDLSGLHDEPYLLSMANSGPNTNSSQFFITTRVTAHLNGKHCVFGRVVDGHEVVDALNAVDVVGSGGKPKELVLVSDSGDISARLSERVAGGRMAAIVAISLLGAMSDLGDDAEDLQDHLSDSSPAGLEAVLTCIDRARQAGHADFPNFQKLVVTAMLTDSSLGAVHEPLAVLQAIERLCLSSTSDRNLLAELRRLAIGSLCHYFPFVGLDFACLRQPGLHRKRLESSSKPFVSWTAYLLCLRDCATACVTIFLHGGLPVFGGDRAPPPEALRDGLAPKVREAWRWVATACREARLAAHDGVWPVQYAVVVSAFVKLVRVSFSAAPHVKLCKGLEDALTGIKCEAVGLAGWERDSAECKQRLRTSLAPYFTLEAE